MKKEEYDYLIEKYGNIVMSKDQYISNLQKYIEELQNIICSPTLLEPMKPITVCAICAKKLG